MSISELISELRDSFRQSDFDRVEETLIVREAKLKKEIKEKNREIELLMERVNFLRTEKMSVEIELKRAKEITKDGGDIVETENIKVCGGALEMNYKSMLQEFVQKCGYVVPEYQTINEGMPHAPEFRSSVTAGEITITSQDTYRRLIDAQQSIARIAFESLTEKIKGVGRSFVLENIQSSKFILNEFATKLKLQPPSFDTNWLYQGGSVVWESFVVFNGISYATQQAGNKKDAINLAAHIALLSILENPNLGLILCQMMRPKIKDGSFLKNLKE